MIAIIFQVELRRKWAAVDTIMKKLTPAPTFMVRLAVAPVRRSPYTHRIPRQNTWQMVADDEAPPIQLGGFFDRPISGLVRPC
jgi:hypothetical protein